jgi:hypothetical protein
MSAVMVQTPEQGARLLATAALSKGFRPEGLHCYADANGEPLFWRIRLKHPNGDKWMRPMHWTGTGYAKGEPKMDTKPLYRLPDLVATDPVTLIYVVEGETCADALARLGMTATTSGSCTSANAGDWEPLRGRSVRIWPDNDDAGAKYAADVVAHLRAIGCVVEVVEVETLNLPHKGDCVDWLALYPDATAGDVLALAVSKVVPDRSANQKGTENWLTRAPEPLPSPLPSVPLFEATLMPESVRDWCEDAADGLQVPLDFTAIPAMVALAGAIGRGVAVAMKEHGRWYERPVLWGCVVGRPSSGKSPALSPARRMLERLAGEELQAHASAMRAYESRAMVIEAQKANAKEGIRKAMRAGDSNQAEALADAALFGDDAPSEPRIVVNDATVEKLGELLNANPRGLVQCRDELAGWLANLDREGRDGDRSFWLECWNGTGQFTVDRIGRGTIRIDACAVSILGGMQPGKLAEYVRGAIRGGFSDDGLMQRFQLAVYPDLSSSWKYTDRPPNPRAEAEAWATFQRLRALKPENIGAETSEVCDVPFLRMDAEALRIFIEWQTALMQRLRGGDEPAWMESHLAKFPALAGRLALVLHLADNGTGPISAEALARALGWCDYLEGHARRIYAPAIDNGLTAAHILLRKRGDLGESFTGRDVYRRGWSGLTDVGTVVDGLSVLSDFGHLIESVTETRGRPSVLYTWACP